LTELPAQQHEDVVERDDADEVAVVVHDG
jgi:hypothetical protein